jgi:hypothetical protein
MADGTLDSELLFLIGGRFGPADSHEVPPGGFDGASHHNVATAVYPLGHVISVKNEGYGKGGYSEFVYLRYNANTTPPTMAAKQFAVPASPTVWYEFTNDPDDTYAVETGSAMAVVCLSAMTDGRYGWFWCGGACPEDYISGLADDFATEGNVAAGAVIAHDLVADAIGLGPCAGDTEAVIGFALAADS